MGRFSDTERNNDRRCNGYIGLDILRYGYTYIGILFCYQCIIVVGCHQGVGSSILHTNYFQRNRMFFILVYSSFVHKGSTGGTDIIAAIVNKYKNISFAKMMMYIDFLIIACSYVLFHSVEKMIFGYVVMGVMSYTMDMLINGKRQSVQILVLSDKYEEIATHVNNDIRRGVTVIDGMGWYSKQPKKVLMILAKRNESVKIFRLIKSIDPKAFISQSNVVGVYGEGFDKIKA